MCHLRGDPRGWPGLQSRGVRFVVLRGGWDLVVMVWKGSLVGAVRVACSGEGTVILLVRGNVVVIIRIVRQEESSMSGISDVGGGCSADGKAELL